MLVLLNIILLAVVASCSDQQFRLLPTASTGGSGGGGGGSGTMGVIDCSFESGNFCGWKDDPRDSGAAWSIVDLSSDSEQSGHALCLRPASGAISEDFDDPFEDIPRATKSELSARLWSPRVRMGVAPLMCLKLAYSTRPSMNISARLSLMRHSSGSCHAQSVASTRQSAILCTSDTLWTSTDQPQAVQQSAAWTTASIELHQRASDNSDFKLILEGTIPAGYPDARICVDNITSYTEPCSALEPKPIKPVSSLNWAHYFGMIFIAALALGLIIPILFLVIIIFVCRRRHQYRHSNFANSKLFSTNLWHYIGGKEVSEDPFAEHTASFHRPPFMGNKFVGDGTLAMRNGDMMDLPDVVIPGGRVVAMGYNGGTLGPNGTMRHQSASFNGYPYGSSTMTMGAKPMMGQPGMGYMQSPMTPNMATSQHNAQTMFQPAHFYNGNVDHMQPQQQAAQPPQPVQGTVANNQPPRVQSGPVQQSAPAVVPPSNYFRSLTQAAEDHPAPVAHAGQPAAAANQPVAHPPVSINDYAGNTAASLEDNGLFVLPDPPSDGGQPGAHGSVERDQADALEALNSATEVNVSAAAAPAPRSTVTTTSAVATAAPAGEAVYTGEHPPPGYDEAVGMVPSRRDQQKAALPVPAAAAVAPVLPPRRAGAGGQFAANGQPEAAAGLSLAERYGLPVADI